MTLPVQTAAEETFSPSCLEAEVFYGEQRQDTQRVAITEATSLQHPTDRRADLVVGLGGLVGEQANPADDGQEDQAGDHAVFDGRGAALVLQEPGYKRSRSQATSGSSAGGIG